MLADALLQISQLLEMGVVTLSSQIISHMQSLVVWAIDWTQVQTFEYNSRMEC